MVDQVNIMQYRIGSVNMKQKIMAKGKQEVLPVLKNKVNIFEVNYWSTFCQSFDTVAITVRCEFKSQTYFLLYCKVHKAHC